VVDVLLRCGKLRVHKPDKALSHIEAANSTRAHSLLQIYAVIFFNTQSFVVLNHSQNGLVLCSCSGKMNLQTKRSLLLQLIVIISIAC